MDKNIKSVLNYIKAYIPLVVFSILMAVVIVVCNLYIPILIGRGVDVIAGRGRVDFNLLSKLTARGVAAVFIGMVAQWLMNVSNNRVTYGVVRDIRRDAFAKLEVLPLSRLDAHPVGDMVSRVIADVDQFADGLLMGFTQFLTGVLTIVGTLVIMIRLNLPCAVAVIALTPISFLVAGFIASHTFQMFLKQSQTRGEQTAFIEEILKGMRVVKACVKERDMANRFDEINDRLSEASLKATFYSSLTNPSTRFVNSLVYASVASLGAMLCMSGSLTIGILTSFLSYANQYMKPFNEISGVVTELQNALTCAGRVFDLLDQESETDVQGASEETSDRGSIELNHVSFSYVPERKLITDLNLKVEEGKHVAIVGPTGCGKTTLINLLMRFYDVDSGEIRLDGRDIRSMTRHALRSGYGMVLQDTWIRTASVRDNILMGRSASDEEVVRAAKSAYADGFIRRLPRGYDTVISEEDSGLSVGQKQLLCIARIMLFLPAVLILDEATSSIDTMTEQRIQKAFEKLMSGRTSFVVAHRLSTIRNADVILVMKDGDVIEQGDHEALMKKGGFYRKLYLSQFCTEQTA